ncbi:hypothetical protein CONPUDRAFT_122162 [Coniophora puteana RWD-64-598 SS2]|uniref:J domain-containing protein n=1 Tax=Coniophora puteana (strain RWD-64-598) TaxID=741705 RepID=A0A5M3MRH6_CONPW|nr:uncharacterized protein CONPUDRAFT_122162 [Coniophora puteana RWD-64-598 SS2]EIW81677.1 hypothetical protein CONPUDRAFT_122162 [Coniophora puteana RWD-64-598 SS2]
MRFLSLSSMLLFAASAFADNTDPGMGGLVPPGLQPIITRADAFLQAGLWSDAAKTYSEAIDLSPTDYLLFYKRATAYFSANRHTLARDDFNKVLELTSPNEFDKALLMLAKIHSKSAEWDGAREMLVKYKAKVPEDPDVPEMENDMQEAEAAATKARNARRAQLWTACSESATQALRVAGLSTELREVRAECNLAAGEVQTAVMDLGRIGQLTTQTTDSLMRIFRLSYFLLPPSPATAKTNHMTPLKSCLHLDPDSSTCLPAHRLVKSLDKAFTKLTGLVEANDWRGVITHIAGKSREFPGDGLFSTFDDALAKHATPDKLASTSTAPVPDPKMSSPRRALILGAACRAFVKVNTPKKGEAWCDALLAMAAETVTAVNEAPGGSNIEVDAWVGKGEALLLKEEWEEAVRAFERAFEASGRADREVLGRLQKAQRLLKQSKQKDYYKVLDVPRDADARTIKKAFRKAAMKAHPDKGGSEAKMATVNEAYEVLSKPELRQRFDNGDDPNDPSSGGGHPFTGYANPFGSGGGGGGGHPFAQFFQQGGGGFQSGGSFSFGRGGHGRGH